MYTICLYTLLLISVIDNPTQNMFYTTLKFLPQDDACVINTICYAAGDVNPALQFQQCLPEVSSTSWTAIHGLSSNIRWDLYAS